MSNGQVSPGAMQAPKGSLGKTGGSEASSRSGHGAEKRKRGRGRTVALPLLAPWGLGLSLRRRCRLPIDAARCWALCWSFQLQATRPGPAPLGQSSWHRAWWKVNGKIMTSGFPAALGSVTDT